MPSTSPYNFGASKQLKLSCLDAEKSRFTKSKSTWFMRWPLVSTCPCSVSNSQRQSRCNSPSYLAQSAESWVGFLEHISTTTLPTKQAQLRNIQGIQQHIVRTQPHNHAKDINFAFSQNSTSVYMVIFLWVPYTIFSCNCLLDNFVVTIYSRNTPLSSLSYVLSKEDKGGCPAWQSHLLDPW